ncbi:hypothetical protein L2E82_43030 [Cichorium intybus]|uniref:Uncharacterized protein n=1 Tax=Cichorium intybus TaxID=13427 RepID=A0ACB8ZM17_CICIN|nr:hypothetical protein L2E82_43030 [Cichorium intybus]
MTIDKSWIKERNRRSPKFLEGLRNFIEIAKSHVDDEGKAFCPCRDCVNSYWHVMSTIYAHVHDRGFQHTYKIWTYHGEEYPASDLDTLWAARRHTTTTHEMFDVIDDVMAEQDTFEENRNEEGSGADPEFDALFEELNTELYPGCTWMSSLNFLAKMMHIKVINKWTDSSFDQLLEFLRVVFPKENKIPTSHYEAKKKLRKIGLGYQSIHACVNDCALYWKENASLQNCPVCKESRWVDKHTKGKKVPQKVLRYFPLTSRLRRRYSSRFTEKDMTWHNTGRSDDGMMRHPVDGKAWQEFDKRYPEFAKEPRNVRLGLAADGFNPFSNMTQPYSMATRVARGHGGDGGADPPRGPDRIPSTCESSNPKKTRGKGKDLNLLEEFVKNNEQPLPLLLDDEGNKFKMIGDNYQMYIRLVSNEVGRRVPMHYPSWKAVPSKHKREIYPTLHHYFDIDAWKNTRYWNGVVHGIEADCANAYKRRKHDLKEYFDEQGGYDDIERARAHPPPTQTPRAWEKVIDKLFTTDKYKTRSLKNKGNRELLPYTSSHGTESYAQKRYKEVQKTGKSSDIEVWRKSHFKEGRGWVNDKAQSDWVNKLEKIQVEYKTMLDKADGDETNVNEIKCLERALGERRGHTRGVGRKIQNIPAHYVPDASTSSQNFNQFTQQFTQQMTQQFNQHLQTIFTQNNIPFQPLQFDPTQLQNMQILSPNNQGGGTGYEDATASDIQGDGAGNVVESESESESD